MNNDKLNLSVRANEVHNNPRSPLLSEKIRYNYGKQQRDDHPPPAGNPELTQPGTSGGALYPSNQQNAPVQPYQNNQYQQAPYPNQPQPMASVGNQSVNVSLQGFTKSNSVGTAGFVLALLGLLFCWIPFVGWILWLLGAILSIVGIFRTPRGLAIAGTVISFIDLIILVAVISAISSGISSFI